MNRRIVVTICPREPGLALLPLEAEGRRRRLDARALGAALETIVARRGLADRVEIHWGCAGGCAGAGPNVSLTFYALPRPGERADHVAVDWRTYVAALDRLPCVATIVDENVETTTRRSITAAGGRPPSPGTLPGAPPTASRRKSPPVTAPRRRGRSRRGARASRDRTRRGR